MRFGAIGLGIVLSTLATVLDAPSMEHHGYYKNFLYLLDPSSPAQSSSPMGAVVNRLRTVLALSPSQNTRLKIAYDFSPRLQDRALLTFPQPVGVPERYRIFDLRERIYPAPGKAPENFAIYQNLDRLCLVASLGPVDVALGRQAIAWGSSRGVSPTDIIAPFIFNELDVEDRPGVDALRLRLPTEAMGEIDCAYVAGEGAALDESAAYLRYRFTPAGTDATLLVAAFRENLLLGCDLAGTVAGASYWLELAWVSIDRLASGRSGSNYTRISLGGDYSPASGVYGFVEYHFNGAGTSRAGEYLARARGSAFTEGSVYLLGRHYVTAGVGWDLSALDRLDLQTMANVNDGSVFLSLRLDHSLSEDLYMESGALLGTGKEPQRLEPPGAAPEFQPRSEFGYIPDLFFLSLRVYY